MLLETSPPKKSGMNYLLPLFITVFIYISVPMMAQNITQEPPLIDRSIFFDNPEIAGGQLSPDGMYISFMKAHNGILNIWVKKFDEPFENARRLTNLDRPSGGYFWTHDGKYILYVNDKGGNENYNVFAVAPSAKAENATGIPASRNITPFDSAVVQIYMVSKKNPDVLMIGLNNRDPKWHDLYQLEISSGKLTKISENKDRIISWIFDWEEQPRLALRSPEDGSTEFLSLINGKYKKIYTVSAMESASPLAFTKDNGKLYVNTNKGNSVNLSKLVLMDPKTGATTDVEQDPQKRVDLESTWFSEKSKSLIYTLYYDEKARIYFNDKAFEKDYNFLKSKFPNNEISITSITKDERKLLFSISSDVKVSTVYFFDRDSKQIIDQYTPRPRLKAYEAYFSPMEPIRYKSSDGLEIPAYLTVPKNSSGKNLPLLVFPHGGPWARSYWGFNSFAQLFANRGYAVLDPNFRGSTGYGKKYLDAGNLQWGRLMQDDITWGVKHLIQKGIADPKKVVIMGGSYGGYATLAGLTFTPDLYVAGVDLVGPSNLFTLLATIPPYWEGFRKQFTLRMGDDATEAGRKILTDASPLFHAKNIKAPLMIIQGANDPRVKKAESDQIVVALRDLKRDVQYILANDEGHGFHKPVNNMAMIAASEKFLAKYTGARYQADMPEDVASRLKEMTVDISTVELARKTETQVPAKLPAFSSDLQEGSFQYNSNISVGAQNIKMDMTRSVQKEGNDWVVTDQANSAMGAIVDKAFYTQGALLPLKRLMEQGSVTIQIDKEKDGVKVTAMGNSTVIPINGAYIADGAGSDMLIARLPLAVGYSISYYGVDVMTMKAKQMVLNVLGKESWNGIETLKVSIVNADQEQEKTTLWIDPLRKLAVKVEQVIPSLNNAVMTIELK